MSGEAHCHCRNKKQTPSVPPGGAAQPAHLMGYEGAAYGAGWPVHRKRSCGRR